MKKVLLATTMLAGTAGFASAEVSVTGYAEIGIWSNTAGDLAFWQDVEVTFGMSGTTDGGLEFGAKIDLDEGDVALNDDSGTEVWVSGAFGKITMGDTDGALDWATADAGALTSLADDHTTHAGYYAGNGLDGASIDNLGAIIPGGDGQIVRYENTIGAFGFALSLEQIGNGADTYVVGTGTTATTLPGETIWGVGLKYAADLGGTTVNFGLGHQKITGYDVSATAVSVDGSSGPISGMIGFTRYDLAGTDLDHIGLGLTYSSGPLALHANYGKYKATGVSEDSWGLAANYDLGGGAVVMFGYGSDMDFGTPGSQDQWSLGLGLSF
jgi:outer membrane protein OmpU